MPAETVPPKTRLSCLIVQPIHPAGVQWLEQAGITVLAASSDAMTAVVQEISNVDAVITRSAGLNAHAM